MKLKFYLDLEITHWVWSGQCYIFPTVVYTYDKYLHGRNSLDFTWLNWGVTLYFGKSL